MSQPTSFYVKDRSMLLWGFTEKCLSKDLVKEGHLKDIGLGIKYKKIKPKK